MALAALVCGGHSASRVWSAQQADQPVAFSPDGALALQCHDVSGQRQNPPQDIRKYSATAMAAKTHSPREAYSASNGKSETLILRGLRPLLLPAELTDGRSSQ